MLRRMFRNEGHTPPFIRPSFGAVAKLGDLYDRSSDNFTGETMFTHELSNTECRTKRIPNKQTFLRRSSTFFDKVGHWTTDEDLELGLNIVGGAVILTGCGKHFEQTVSGSEQVNCTLIHQITTVQEEINFYNHNVKEVISVEAIENSPTATHFVYAINWGATLFLTGTYHNTDIEIWKGEISNQLLACFRRVELAAKGVAYWNCKEYESRIVKDSTFHYMCDTFPEQTLQVTVEQAYELISNFPNVLAESLDEKGIQVGYFLAPLSILRHLFEDSQNVSKFFNPSQCSMRLETYGTGEITLKVFMNRVVKLFDDMHTANELLKDLGSDAMYKTFHFSPEPLQEIETLQEQFRTDFRALLPEVKRGIKPFLDMLKLIQKYEESDFSGSKIIYLLDHDNSSTESRRRAEMYYLLRGHNVTFIAKGTRFSEDYSYTFGSRQAYVLYTSYRNKTHEKNNLRRKNIQMFLMMIRSSQLNPTRPKFIYVDTDISQDFPMTGISHYRNGVCVSFNSYRNQRNLFHCRVVKNKILSIFTF